MKRLRIAFAAAALSAFAAASHAAGPPPSVPNAPASAPAPATAAGEHTVGAAKILENLTVFPITSKTQVDLGSITTLEDALAKKTAEVRETGTEQRIAPGSNAPQMQRSAFDGAQVNALVIENKGDVPIYVLAGTVVKGGKQDRQIGQDFIIESKKTIDVDAFCVEHGRWTAERNGVATGGTFGTSPQLVTSPVRAAAQYKKNQGEVWSKVDATNAVNHKVSASSTLMATLDDGEIAQKRAALAARVNAHLVLAQPGGKPEDVIGMAYAVDGKVRAVRWFANHKVFELYRATLANTAAVDAITALSGARPSAALPAVTPDAVTAFIAGAERAKETEKRETAGGNTNTYYDAVDSYSSRTMLKPSAASPSAPKAAPAVPLSTDVLAK